MNTFKIIEYIKDINNIPFIIISTILIFFLAFLAIRIMFINKKTFGVMLALLFILSLTTFILGFFKYNQNFQESLIKNIMILLSFVVAPLISILLVYSDISKNFDTILVISRQENKNSKHASTETIEILADTIFELSSRKIGALITIEKYMSLDQFADKAISLNADVTKELLLTAFVPNTPLHDGAIIIRNDKVVCAGAYFNLTKNTTYEKSTGSRHRAAIGISEISDAITIVASEETGDVSITYDSMLIPIPDKEKLLSYLETFTN